MNTALHPDTQKLIEERMQRGGYPTADDMLRAALKALDQFDGDKIDDATWAAIEGAEAQYQQGEGIPLDEAFARLREKHFGE